MTDASTLTSLRCQQEEQQLSPRMQRYAAANGDTNFRLRYPGGSKLTSTMSRMNGISNVQPKHIG